MELKKVNRLIYKLFGDKHDITEFPTLEYPRYRSKKVHELNPKIKIDNRLLGWNHMFLFEEEFTIKKLQLSS